MIVLMEATRARGGVAAGTATGDTPIEIDTEAPLLVMILIALPATSIVVALAVVVVVDSDLGRGLLTVTDTIDPPAVVVGSRTTNDREILVPMGVAEMAAEGTAGVPADDGANQHLRP